MNTKTRFEKLLEPHHIGRVKTRNRIVKTAAGMSYQTDDYMNEKTKAYYEGLAKGGAGLLMVESPAIDYPLSLMFPVQFRLDDDKYIKGYRELTQVIHKHGCPTFLQMYHCGPWHQSELFGLQPVAASAISKGSLGGSHLPMEVPRSLTIPEIEDLVDKFASAAVRAQKAGFDGVEINSSSNHLLASFLSRMWNKRQDAYGGQSLASRSRFLLAILRETRKRVGPDYPVMVTINGVEVGGGEDDRTCAEGVEIARMLEEAGADVLHVRFFWLGYDISVLTPEVLFYPEPHIPVSSFSKELDWSHKGPGAILPVTAAIKKAVSIPVIAVGGLNPELGEKALHQGKADFIGLCRRLMADPELPNKLASGKEDDIRPCLACLQCMHGRPEPVPCAVNASLGREREYTVKQAAKKKRVLIAGGGPAGMEAARVAALRGHEVVLYEREPKLGGWLPLAAMIKGTEIEDLPALVRYLERQITTLGVKTVLGKEVNIAVVEEIKPDAVILATGGLPALPDIPGINGHNVVNSYDLYHSLKDYPEPLEPEGIMKLELWKSIGKNVVIIGGAIQGCVLAEFLVKRGRRVAVVDTAEELGEGLAPEKRLRLTTWFPQKGVVMMTEVSYEEITDKGLTIMTKEGERQTIKADTIVTCVPLVPNNELLKRLQGKVPEIHAIGDGKEPRLILDAIADGSRIAHAI